MFILGISCYYHDAAAALLHDGQLVAAADEERFSRIKHDSAFPALAIAFCLARAGISAQDLDYVVFYEKPLPKFERILLTSLSSVPRSVGHFRDAMATWFSEKLWIKSQLVSHLRIAPGKVLFVEHHLSHAASAFFCSPYTAAAILTVDGVGEWTTTALGHATADWTGDGSRRNQIELTRETRFPHSLGLLYSAFTAWLGFRVNDGEYKVMGMAPYGEPRYLDRVAKVLRAAADGSFALNMDYFSFHHSATHTFSPHFVDLFGPPRSDSMPFVTEHTGQPETVDRQTREQNQYYADVAASIQVATEEALLQMVRQAHQLSGSENLCIAGGVALNSVANGRIVREGPFRSVYVQPAAGDNGGALGAALYAHHVLLGQPRRYVMEHAYWGADYTPAQIATFLRAQGLPHRELDEQPLVAELVDELTRGKVLGWFQGRFEWGPRALGNRSILADPRRAEMKEIVNEKIKFREPFRPFAPVILESRAHEYFTTPALDQSYLARYMLLVSPVVADKQSLVPATTHVGGTGRLQTVRREWNQRYYDLIHHFGQATGVPVLLNTSFNLRGEPIVTSPAHAFNTFVGSDIDTLVLGNFVVRKSEMGGRWDPTVKGAVGE